MPNSPFLMISRIMFPVTSEKNNIVVINNCENFILPAWLATAMEFDISRKNTGEAAMVIYTGTCDWINTEN